MPGWLTEKYEKFVLKSLTYLIFFYYGIEKMVKNKT